MKPLTLADGTQICPQSGKPIMDEQEEVYTEVPNYADTQRQIVAARTRVADFPLPPSQMTSIGIILFYSMLGVSDDEISSLTGLGHDQIGRMRVSDSYIEIQKQFLDSIVNNDMEDVRTLFVQGSRNAASRMVGLMNSESESIQIAAAKDILDRAGQRPVDVIEHRHRMENSLRIEIVKKDNLEDIPVIEGSVNAAS